MVEKGILEKMKYIKYKTKTVYTFENGEEITEYNECMCIYTPKNEEIAKREAYNGEYTIEDDGKPDPAPTQLDRIEAQTTYTAMMTDTLLEG